jgi:hypothetical protein
MDIQQSNIPALRSAESQQESPFLLLGLRSARDNSRSGSEQVLMAQLPIKPKRSEPENLTFSVVAMEIKVIRDLVGGYPTEALSKLCEERQAVADAALQRLESAAATRARCGFFDWLSGRTAIAEAALEETRAEHAEAARLSTEAEHLSERLEQADQLFSKRQPTLALRNLQHIKLHAPVDVRLEEPIKRAERLLAS